MRKIVFLSIFSFAYGCDIIKGIEIPASKINDISYIENKIDKGYNQKQINSIKLKIDNCNQNISSNINNLNSNINISYNYYQTISNNKDIKEISKQIEKKRKAIDDAKTIMQNSLKGVGFSGIFTVRLDNISMFAKKEELQKRSESIITPTAIESLNGIYLKTITTIENNNIKDMINQQISGKVIIQNVYLAEIDRKDKKFFYLVKVKVLPLEKTKGSNRTSSSDNNIDAHWIKPNQNIDKISSKYQKDVNNILNKFYFTLEQENEQERIKQEDIIENYNTSVEENMLEIKKLKRKLKRTDK
ncbi:MAG: hypothetical protein U9Q30_08900, partial [Campylobacterota bacterium]|nr:hypothetical protein [Campylobacterota bacterium]